MPGVLSNPKASCLPLVLLLPEPGAPVMNVPSTRSRSLNSSWSESDNIGRSRIVSWVRIVLLPAEEFAEGHDGRREGGAVHRRSELEPPAQEVDVSLLRVFMPPTRIDARGKQAYDERAIQRLRPGLAHPLADFAAIGRIHEYLARPGLGESVIRLCEEPGALGVLRRRTRVEREAAENAVQLIKQVGRRFPFG